MHNSNGSKINVNSVVKNQQVKTGMQQTNNIQLDNANALTDIKNRPKNIY